MVGGLFLRAEKFPLRLTACARPGARAERQNKSPERFIKCTKSGVAQTELPNKSSEAGVAHTERQDKCAARQVSQTE
jgi:hypothetical protein